MQLSLPAQLETWQPSRMGWFLGAYWTIEHGELGRPCKPRPEAPNVDYWDSQLSPEEAFELEQQRLAQLKALEHWDEN